MRLGSGRGLGLRSVLLAGALWALAAASSGKRAEQATVTEPGAHSARAEAASGVAAAAEEAVTAAAASSSSTSTPTPTPAPARIAGPGAFDLALADAGVVLAWSPPRAQGGGLFVQRLDTRGTPREPALRLAQTDAGGEVIEVAVTTLGARIGAAWIESSPEESRTRALLVTPGEPSPPEPARLALAAGGLAPGRSRLAVRGGRTGGLRVLHARSTEDCGRGHSESCAGYTFTELGDDGPRGASGEWLRVPSPCPDVPPLLAGAGDAFYYAVCAETGAERVTTAYGVDVQNEYAHAVQVLSGCTPSALLAPLRDGAWVVGRCADGVRVAELGLDATRGAREHALDGLEAVCVDGVITLRAGELTLPLTQPLDGIEALLPEALAPVGSVAVFTGEAIVVVREAAGELSLGRHACERGVLAESR